MAKAVNYALTHMPKLARYVNNGRFRPDNNDIEEVISHLEKNYLIILDDFGLQPLDANSRLALLQILEERYERKSMIIISQLPVSKWYDYIAEPTLADEIMDRLVSNAVLLELKGESMRRKKKK